MDDASDEEWVRKARMERRLKTRAVLINPHLPIVESVAEATIRPPSAVAKRALALYAVILHSEDPQGPQARRFLQAAGLWEAATPKERAFLLENAPDQNELIQYSWRTEALWVLLWALGHIPDLDFPEHQCDVQIIREQIGARPVEGFIGEAEMRPANQILDEADFIYRCHWAVVEAELHDQVPTGDLDPDVVAERHYALNWLVGYLNQEWDDVSTDT